MKLRVTVPAALAIFFAATVFNQTARAQSKVNRGYARVSQAQMVQAGRGPVSTSPSPTPAEYDSGGYSSEYPSGGYSSGPAYGDGCYDNSCPGSCGCDDGWNPGCCDTCGEYGCGGGCGGGLGCGILGCPPGQIFFTADYLYVRSNFSEAIAYLDHDASNAPVFTDTFHELDFNYASSYRFGGGYRLCGCNEQVRFMFTRLTSSADDSTTNPNAVGPFETSPGPDGALDVHAQVDVKSYDVEFAKTIPLGGNCGCCSPCDCGPHCPSWDVTWSGGFRFAQVDWNRTYDSNNDLVELSRTATSTLNFNGGGPRFGVEGRRYFGQGGCFSAYMKGDISLLLGDVDIVNHRVSTTGINPSTVETQSATFRNIIPVTEIEAGLTGHIVKNVSITSGYLFNAWHDLGFRDQFDFATFLETSYDDANILGFNGFFTRLEVAF